MTRTKFNWDDDKKMVVITIEDIVKWNEYVESFPEASGYQNKTIENWDDIVVLCGSDRATGDGAETYQDAAEAMDQEGNDAQSNINLEEQETSRTHPQSSGKKAKKDHLADAVMEIAHSFKEYLESKKISERPQPRPQPTGEEIYDVVSQIQGLQKVDIFSAVRKLMQGFPEEFYLLKSLQDDEKKEWIKFLIES
ncbi:uncharacterized protein LOC126671019 isoform X3 [Mercurialis annua]|uniref:uncharacterized protein LOC126671019 isoform X3 n=1 Tax=Mercurialis annua TaxID=3986 RepID=UPI00215F3A18|nr:uncharacterized protein LOC126671019 isoform X3 [Mercurialis annua]